MFFIFVSPEGVLIMTRWIKLYMMDYDEVFPSPTGVSSYEFRTNPAYIAMKEMLFPSPSGVTYYELLTGNNWDSTEVKAFPSPTGVTYYEYF